MYACMCTWVHLGVCARDARMNANIRTYIRAHIGTYRYTYLHIHTHTDRGEGEGRNTEAANHSFGILESFNRRKIRTYLEFASVVSMHSDASQSLPKLH